MLQANKLTIYEFLFNLRDRLDGLAVTDKKDMAISYLLSN
jgi:hypothetical protein